MKVVVSNAEELLRIPGRGGACNEMCSSDEHSLQSPVLTLVTGHQSATGGVGTQLGNPRLQEQDILLHV